MKVGDKLTSQKLAKYSLAEKKEIYVACKGHFSYFHIPTKFFIDSDLGDYIVTYLEFDDCVHVANVHTNPEPFTTKK